MNNNIPVSIYLDFELAQLAVPVGTNKVCTFYNNNNPIFWHAILEIPKSVYQSDYDDGQHVGNALKCPSELVL